MTDTNSEDAQILKIGDTQRAVIAAMFCLGMYEYLVTFDREIRLVWRRRFTATTALFMALRAIMILGPFVNWVPPSSDFSRSMASSMIALALALLGLALFALFSALRVHALWHGSQMQWAFSATVFVLAFVPVVTNIADTVYVAYSLPPSLREAYFCNRIVGLSPKLSEKLIYLTRSCVIATDLLVLALTWIKSFRHFQDMRMLEIKSSVATVLLRDGTVYFIAHLVINVTLLATLLTHAALAYAIADTILQYIPTVLIQRFMLNLRQLSYESDASQTSSGVPQSSCVFEFRGTLEFSSDRGRRVEGVRTEDTASV